MTLSLDANSCACAYSVLFSLVLALMLLFVSFRLTQTALVHHTTHASIPLFSLDKFLCLYFYACVRLFHLTAVNSCACASIPLFSLHPNSCARVVPMVAFVRFYLTSTLSSYSDLFRVSGCPSSSH